MGAVIIPQNLPVGYRFHPTDEEFVDHYLKNRVLGYVDRPCVIPDVDICRWDPWELPYRFQGESIIPPDDKVQEWWFFCLQTPQQGRRSTPSGFWKKTGTDRNIKARDTNRVIGTKKTLVFHKGRGSKGINTKWVIHEYHLLANELNRNYVLCWLKHTRDEKADNSTVELVHGAINLADLDSDLHLPDHEDSFPEPLIREMTNSLIGPPFLPENRVSSDFLQLPQPTRRSQNSLPSNINQLMNTESPSFLDFSLENRFQPENRVSSDFLQLPQPTRRSQNSLPSNINQFMNTESPSFLDFSLENRFQPENRVSSDFLQLPQPTRRSQNSLPSNINQFMNTESLSFIDFSLENRFQPENRVSSDFLQLPQPARRSQNSLPSNINQFMNTESPSFVDFSLENSNTNELIQLELPFGTSEEDEDFGNMLNEGLWEEDEDVEVPSGDLFYDDFFDGHQMQTGQYGPTSHSHDERPVLMENRRSGTISVHGVVPLERKKGMVENKFNGSLVAPEKPMAPLIRARSVKYCSKDEKPRSEKVKQETATKNIKPESISLDEAAATAKVLKDKEHGSAGNSPKKTDSKEIEHAREKSNSVTTLTGLTTVSTKSSTSPRLLNLMNMLVGILLLNAIAKYFISDFHCRFSP